MAKKKTLLIVSIIFIMTIIISALTPLCAYAEESKYQPRLEAPDSSIPYYSRELNIYFQTGYGMPNCVAYAYGRIYEMNGEKPKFTHGSAGDWYSINKNNGFYDYGSEPKLGAVACWSNHVAVVEQISESGAITLSESHWGGTYFDTVTYTDMTSHFGQSFYGYIYTYNGVKETVIEPEAPSAPQKERQYKNETIVNPKTATSFDIIKFDLNAEIDEKQMVLGALL